MNLMKTKLDNGLTVLIRESHTAPVASFWVWYRVGSRNEHLGITGISHWVEHMLFKGTERWPQGSIDQSVAREGGVFNGMTWYDFTTYYETLPVEKVSLAMDIESDRMSNAVFDPEEVAAERTVIISERQGNENSPLFQLSEEVYGAAFRVHTYGHETLGHQCDLESMTREDLYQHYRTYYAPNNAIIALCGDFNAGEMERIIERYFAGIPEGPEIPPFTAKEPQQRGERRVVVEGGASTEYLKVAYHIPEATHPDFFALTIMNAILSGGSGFLVSSGELTNRTSRLYKSLVDRDLAVDVSGSVTPTINPYLYRITATVRPGETLANVEAALEDEIAHLQETLITTEELEKAQRQARALFAYSSESITNQAFWLGFSEIFANYGWFMQYLNKLQAVTAEDVQRVAQLYLNKDNRTTGWYVAKK
ncbi:MAG: insulinase family protein [Anaerolineae bacterium]|nr:insulinase family protein [Anaerolineae bacterium]